MARRRQKIWITRAQPGADATAERVRALGHDALIAPLLAVRALEDVQVDLHGVAALAFTSANGIAAFVDRSPERSLPVFAVGAATADIARKAGFGTVSSADGDVETLALLIAARGPYPGVVFHLAPAEGAGDLAGVLRGVGIPARRLVVYRSVDRPPDPATAALIPDLTAVLLHSPRAGRGLAAWLASHPAPNLIALCLSTKVAAPLSDLTLAAVRVAVAPTEAALLALLDAPGNPRSGAG